MGYFKNRMIDIQEAIVNASKNKFNTDKEMHEAFEKIAEDFDIKAENVWSIFYDLETEGEV